MKAIKWIVAIVCGLALLSACRTPSAGIMVESYPHNKITVNSKIVGGWLTVTEVNAARRNDLLQAQVTVQNATQKDVQFEYQYEWLNKDGMTVDTPMNTWVPVSLSAKALKPLKAIAPHKEADDFRLLIRFNRPSTRW